MLTIFNRTELITTMDMQHQANIRSILSANGIAYTVRTENLQGSSAFGGRSRGGLLPRAAARRILTRSMTFSASFMLFPSQAAFP